MKKLVAVAVALVMVLVCFTGCMYGEDQLIINADGSGLATSRLEFEKSIVDAFAESMEMTVEDLGIEGATVETVDGVECYVVEDSTQFSTMEELKAGLEEGGYNDVYASETGVRFVFSSGVTEEDVEMMEEMDFDLGDSMAAKIIITMPTEIIKTTGTLSEDKKTAEFYFEGNDFYKDQDVMVSTAEETEKPVISGATNKKTYNSARTITGKDASGIQKIQYKYKKSSKASYGKYYTIKGSKTFTKNGTYYVRAYDYYGNKTVKTFTIKDTSKPTITGVKNKKTYSSERIVEISDNCAVKSVKYYINGKRVETDLDDVLIFGILAEDSGTHKVVVTDVNGNSRTVIFKIK